jgi:hypothetical protein
MTIIKQSPLHSINCFLTQVPTNAPQQLPVQSQSEWPAFQTPPPPDITTALEYKENKKRAGDGQDKEDHDEGWYALIGACYSFSLFVSVLFIFLSLHS